MHDALTPGRQSRRIASALAVGALVTAWEATPHVLAGGRGRLAARVVLLATAVPTMIALTPHEPPADALPRNTWDTLPDRAAELADPRVAVLATAGAVASLLAASRAERRGGAALTLRIARGGRAHAGLKAAVLLGAAAAVATYVDPPAPR